MRRVFSMGAIVLALSGSPAQAQFKVELLVSEPSRGLFDSTFRQALERIGDVAVVGPGESADYRLRVTVLCDPSSCERPVGYDLSVVLSMPISQEFVPNFIATYELENALPDSAVAILSGMTATLEQHLDAMVASWGVERYEGAVNRWVAQFDSQCLERRRLARRIGDTPDGPERERMIVRWRDGTWTC